MGYNTRTNYQRAHYTSETGVALVVASPQDRVANVGRGVVVSPLARVVNIIRD